MTFDPKQLTALSAIIEEQGFEQAALKLNITQSAVSQRLRQLESTAGHSLVIRTNPPQLTEAGFSVLKYFQQTSLLQNELLKSLNLETEIDRQTLSIGVNADSLATWLFDALKPLLDSEKILLEVKVDDQENTRELLSKGEVIGCITSDKAPIQGCNSIYLGVMRYRCVASREFKTRYFKSEPTRDEMLAVPAVQFNNKDELQTQYMKAYFDTPKVGLRHRIPSTESYLDFILRGYAWGMVPDVQSNQLLNSNKGVIELSPGQFLDIPLYWHIWNLKTQFNKSLTKAIVDEAKRILIH